MHFRLSGGLTSGTADWSDSPEPAGQERIPIGRMPPQDDRIGLEHGRHVLFLFRAPGTHA